MRKNPLLRLCSREDDGMSQAIADEARLIVREAAKPIMPGQTVGAQIDAACKALGYPRGSWRITAAWYGNAGCWSAAAISDLQKRFLAWRDAETRRRAGAMATERARQAAADRDLLRHQRDHLAAELQRLNARLALLDGDPS